MLPLKRRLLYRSCAGAGTLTIGFVLFFLAGDYIYIVPFVLMAAVFFVDAGIVACNNKDFRIVTQQLSARIPRC